MNVSLLRIILHGWTACGVSRKEWQYTVSLNYRAYICMTCIPIQTVIYSVAGLQSTPGDLKYKGTAATLVASFAGVLR